MRVSVSFNSAAATLPELRRARTMRSPEAMVSMRIMITSSAEEKDMIRSYNLGVNGYVVKPFTANILKEKIDKIFERIGASA